MNQIVPTQAQIKPKPNPNPTNIKETTQKIKDYLMKQDFKEKFNEHQQKFAKLSQTTQITFDCSLSQQPIVYAIQLKECVLQGQHFDNYMDLEQFLIQKQNEVPSKVFKCPICKKETAFEYIEKAFIPHLLVNDLRKQCGPIPKTLVYQFSNKIAYPVHQGKLGQLANKYFDDIVKIFTNPKHLEGQFYQLVKKFKVNYDFLYYNTCILNSIKVLIPVRSVFCQHFEAFDLLSALDKLDSQKEINCTHQNCNQILTKDNIYIDFDLFESGLKSYSFSFAFQYIYKKNQLFDILENEIDKNLTSYKQIKINQDYLKYQKQIYKQVDQIYNNWQSNQNKTDNFYQTNPIDQLEKDNINLMNCQFTQQRIELPCRCIRCKGFQVCDLRFMSTILHQFQNPTDEENVNNKRLECPLCNNQFVKKIKPKDTPIFEQVYIDVKLIHFLNQTLDFASLTKKNILNFLQNKQKGKVIIQQTDQTLLNDKKGIFVMDVMCQISQSKIRRPVRGNNCTHIQPFEFKVIDMHYDGQIDISDMKCPICYQFQNYFYEDIMLKQYLNNFYLENQQCEKISLIIGIKGIQLKPKQM